MKFTRLEHEQREFFDQNGYMVVHNALDADMLGRVTAACDRIVEEKYEDLGSGRASLGNVVVEDDIFLPLLTWETTVPLVVQLLSFDIRLAKSHLIYNYPDPQDAKPSTDWHRDFMESPFDLGPHRYPRMMIKIAYQLTDTTSLSGNTILVPGSNNYTHRFQIPGGKNDPDGAVELELLAGDAFLFESRTFHRIGLNRTNVPRKCLMMEPLAETLERCGEVGDVRTRWAVLLRSFDGLRRRASAAPQVGQNPQIMRRPWQRADRTVPYLLLEISLAAALGGRKRGRVQFTKRSN